MKPSVLMPPKEIQPLRLYILASKSSISFVLVQNNDKGNEQAIYYLSRTLKDIESRYSLIEKVCLALYFACTKYRHYMIGNTVFMVSKANVLKYMLTRFMVIGRIGKWAVALREFTL